MIELYFSLTIIIYIHQFELFFICIMREYLLGSYKLYKYI